MREWATDRREIPITAPPRLAYAAELAFPDGSVTVSGLRREAARVTLEIESIAGKQYTTLAAIESMRELCRVRSKAQGSPSGDMKDNRRSGPYATGRRS